MKDPLDEPIPEGALVPVRELRHCKLVQVSKEEWEQCLYEETHLTWRDLLELKVGDFVFYSYPHEEDDNYYYLKKMEVLRIG